MTQVSLYLFCLPRTNLKLHNISVTPKMVKKVIMNLDCIPVVVIKNCDPELSYILVELFTKCLESCFPDCWKVSLVVPVLKNVEERSTVKNCRPVSLLFVVSEFFERLVNNVIVINHLGKCGLFPDIEYGFRSSRSTSDLITVVSDRIARAFNKSGAIQAAALDIFKVFNRVWHAGLNHKLLCSR